MRHRALSLLFAIALLAPLSTSAAPIGGQAGLVLPCVNIALYAFVGPPNGGAYIWTPATQTYRYGPPAPGRWILGLSGIPFFCVFSIVPIIVYPGISITMMGSSQ